MKQKELPTTPIPLNFTFDKNSPGTRIGLIALDTDLTMEWDFHRTLPKDVAFYTSHIPVTNPLTPENLRKMAPRIKEVAESILPGYPLDVMAYGCTSASIAIGHETIQSEIQSIRPGVAVVTPSSAAIKGLHALKIEKITLLTPYIDSVNQIVRQFFQEHEIEVTNISSFCFDNDFDTARVPPSAIKKAALEAYHPEADAIFLSCTTLRAIDVLESIEQSTGKPALSSNQCMIWECLESAGYRKPLKKHGQLLRQLGSFSHSKSS
ncbi:MAG: aspartate/glutamate racemase family protein [SAR324 cluster bacterium]|nr:aspartate/glutamate racemase family protein [SAR324 cluster bacterium]